jgi:acetyl-CoA C-acetyltransferase
MTACIVGWSHGRFGKREGLDLEALIAEVAVGAIEDAGLEPADVDAIMVGHFGGGFVKQDFPASLVLQASDAFRGARASSWSSASRR